MKLSQVLSSQFECGADYPNCVVDLDGNAKCAKERDETCTSATSSAFDCFNEGFFPDPWNCKTYFQCSLDEHNEFITDQYACDNYYVFDPSGTNNEYCRLTKNAYCVTVDCKGAVKNILMTYKFFPKTNGQIVASCRSGNKKPLITRCDAGFLADLKTLPVECNLDCKKSEKFVYAGNETLYHECVFNGKGWEPKVKSCFRNYYFNADKKRCDPKSNTPAPPTLPTIPPPSCQSGCEASCELVQCTSNCDSLCNEQCSAITSCKTECSNSAVTNCESDCDKTCSDDCDANPTIALCQSDCNTDFETCETGCAVPAECTEECTGDDVVISCNTDCADDTDCQNDCLNKCTDECPAVAECKTRCKDTSDDCKTTCAQTCVASCSTSIPVLSCKTNCGGSAIDTCSSKCDSDCAAGCSTNADTVACKNSCSDGSCLTDCQANC